MTPPLSVESVAAWRDSTLTTHREFEDVRSSVFTRSLQPGDQSIGCVFTRSLQPGDQSIGYCLSRQRGGAGDLTVGGHAGVADAASDNESRMGEASGLDLPDRT